MSYVVTTGYKFVEVADLHLLQQQLLEVCCPYDIRGTILLASEGINFTLAGTRADIDVVMTWLRADSRLTDLETKESLSEHLPFGRMKVKLKQELIPLGVPGVNPARQVGRYVRPQEWNALISAPDVTLIDTRNDYEVAIGTFKGAKNPHLESFRQFSDYVNQHLDPDQHPKVAMFCTGGIRCEKATAYLLQQGFKEVYHLQGGILKYLEDVAPEASLWEGECFVFDERVAVTHGVKPGSYDMCRACGHPISAQDKADPAFEEGISCPHCATKELSTQLRIATKRETSDGETCTIERIGQNRAGGFGAGSGE